MAFIRFGKVPIKYYRYIVGILQFFTVLGASNDPQLSRTFPGKYKLTHVLAWGC